MTRVCVVLSGSGVYDGAELHESVLTLLALDEAGAEVVMTAPRGPQMHVVNHLTGEVAEGESRDILVESARVARGAITPLDELNLDEVDAVVFPGGFGVAKNLCDFAVKGPDCEINAEVRDMLLSARDRGLPLGFACISPALAAAVFRSGVLTVGSDEDPAAGGVRALGAEHVACEVDGVVVDADRRVVSTPAYMRETTLKSLRTGLKMMVDQVMSWALESSQAQALSQLEGWSLDARSLTKTWRFEGDQAPLEWTQRVWSLAQERQHHPDLSLSYGEVTIKLTTHDQGGLSEADFALAAAIDELG